MSQYTMQYGGGAGTGRAGSLLTPLLPRIAVGATHSSTLWHGSREQAMLCHVCETHQGRRQYSLKPVGRSHCTRIVRRVSQNPVQCGVAG